MVYGERLRAQRMALELTQAILIEKLDIGKSTIINWEKGVTFPTLIHLVELRKLGFNLEYLFSGEGSLVTPPPPPEPYVYVPVYPTEVCAGNGIDAFDATPLYYHAFREAWVKERGYFVSKLAITKIKGESMVPDLLHGDYVLINMANNTPKTGCMFVVRIGQELLAKFIEIQFDGTIILKCKNDFYKDMVITPIDAESDGFHVIGEIVEGSREYLN